MRQFGDTLVWLGLIVVVAAVVYFTPRVASYVSARDAKPERPGRVVWRVPVVAVEASADDMR
jgi:hypothetical protein